MSNPADQMIAAEVSAAIEHANGALRKAAANGIEVHLDIFRPDTVAPAKCSIIQIESMARHIIINQKG
jgi:hypothetical protein